MFMLWEEHKKLIVKIKHVLFPICLVVLYIIYLYFVLSYEHHNGLLIRINEVTATNVMNKLFFDFFNSSLIVIVIIGLTFNRDMSLYNLGLFIPNSICA